VIPRSSSVATNWRRRSNRDPSIRSLQRAIWKPADFSIRDLAEALVPDGREWVRMLDTAQRGSVERPRTGDGIDVTGFLNISGQVIYSAIMDAYNQRPLPSPSWSPPFQRGSMAKRFRGSRGSRTRSTRSPGMPYPTGFWEDYIETPSTTKRGFIVR